MSTRKFVPQNGNFMHEVTVIAVIEVPSLLHLLNLIPSPLGVTLQDFMTGLQVRIFRSRNRSLLALGIGSSRSLFRFLLIGVELSNPIQESVLVLFRWHPRILSDVWPADDTRRPSWAAPPDERGAWASESFGKPQAWLSSSC